MKYNLILATFFILINFASTAQNEMTERLRNNLYASYEENLEKLKKSKLEYLVTDLEKIYINGYEMIKAYWDFFEHNPKLTYDLENANHAAFECVTKEMNAVMNDYEDVTEKLYEALEKTPKNPTCYKDLLTYIEDKKNGYKRVIKNTDEIFEKVEVYSLDTEKTIENLNRLETTIPEAMIKFFKTIMDDYVQEMIDHVKSKTKKKQIQKKSEERVDLDKNRADAYMKDHREKGILNEDNIMKMIKKYKDIQSTCQDMSQNLSSETATLAKYFPEMIADLNHQATATFYIIDDGNNTKKVDCEDHTPHFHCISSENTHSIQSFDNKYIFTATGVDKNGRKYKRNYSSEKINDEKTIIEETIEYQDEIITRKYIVEFAVEKKNNI